MTCPKCDSNSYTKAGFVGNKQRYKCKGCNCHFTHNRKSKSLEMKRIAVHLYLENYSYRVIGDLLGVSDVAILKWVKQYGKDLNFLRQKKMHKQSIPIKQLQNFALKKSQLAETKMFFYSINEHKIDFFEVK